MNPSDTTSRKISLESRVKPLEGGKQCPPFKSKLFELADRIIAQEPLDDEQQVLMGHIENCHLCRSIYSGAIYFSQDESEVPSSNLADEFISGMADDALHKLRRVSREKHENRAIPLSVYFQDLIFDAGLSPEDTMKALGLPEKTSLSDLDVVAKMGLYAATVIGMNEQVAVSRFRFSHASCYSVSSAFNKKTLALRRATMPQSNAAMPQSRDSDLVSMLNGLVSESGVDMHDVDQEIARMGFEL